MSAFPWKPALWISALAVASPLAAGAAELAGMQDSLLAPLYWWFYGLPMLAFWVGVPVEDGLAAIVVLYGLQYLVAWRAADAALALLRRRQTARTTA